MSKLNKVVKVISRPWHYDSLFIKVKQSEDKIYYNVVRREGNTLAEIEFNKVNDTIKPRKREYLYRTTQEEREYLDLIFSGKSEELRYSNHDGNYELFYPYKKGEKIIVLYFSEQQRYGKLGS